MTPSDVECVEFKGMTLLRLTYMLQRRPMFSSSQAKSSRTSFCLTPSRHHTQCHAMLILSHATPTLSSPLLRMFGEWDVMARYSAFDTPLGAAFVDPSFLEAARAPIEQGGLGSSTSYKMRLFSTLPDTWDNNVSSCLATQPLAEGYKQGKTPNQPLPSIAQRMKGSLPRQWTGTSLCPGPHAFPRLVHK